MLQNSNKLKKCKNFNLIEFINKFMAKVTNPSNTFYFNVLFLMFYSRWRRRRTRGKTGRILFERTNATVQSGLFFLWQLRRWRSPVETHVTKWPIWPTWTTWPTWPLNSFFKIITVTNWSRVVSDKYFHVIIIISVARNSIIEKNKVRFSSHFRSYLLYTKPRLFIFDR